MYNTLCVGILTAFPSYHTCSIQNESLHGQWSLLEKWVEYLDF